MFFYQKVAAASGDMRKALGVCRYVSPVQSYSLRLASTAIADKCTEQHFSGTKGTVNHSDAHANTTTKSCYIC
jgi:hypothetical protein